jgi:hypothetical protein
MKVDLSGRLLNSLLEQQLDSVLLRRLAEAAGAAVRDAYLSGENSVGGYRVIDGHGVVVNCQTDSRSKARVAKPSASVNRLLWRAMIQSMEPSKAALAVFAECLIDRRRKLVTVLGLSCTPRRNVRAKPAVARLQTLDHATLERERGELLHRKHFDDGLSEVEEVLLSMYQRESERRLDRDHPLPRLLTEEQLERLEKIAAGRASDQS